MLLYGWVVLHRFRSQAGKLPFMYGGNFVFHQGERGALSLCGAGISRGQCRGNLGGALYRNPVILIALHRIRGSYNRRIVSGIASCRILQHTYRIYRIVVALRSALW